MQIFTSFTSVENEKQSFASALSISLVAELVVAGELRPKSPQKAQKQA